MQQQQRAVVVHRVEPVDEPVRAPLDPIVAQGFARPETHGLLRIVPTVAALMTAIAAEPAPKLAIDPERF